jgi:hypothetical protein
MFQFFSAMVPLVVGGYFYLSKDQPSFMFPYMLVSVALIGLVLSVGFWLIDIRNEQLVNLGRKHICTLEANYLYRDEGFAGVFNSADTVQAPMFGLGRFRVIMPTMYLAAASVFLALAIFASAMNISQAPAQRSAPAASAK